MINFESINRIILFGGGSVLIRVINFLQSMDFELDIVTSKEQKDEVINDKLQLTFGGYLDSQKIDYIISSDINEEQNIISKINKKTLGFSLSARWLFKKKLIEKFQKRFVNVHGSNLPKNRGGGGYSWRIMNNDLSGEVCIHFVETGIDTGDILLRSRFDFNGKCKIPLDFYTLADKKMEELIKSFFNKIYKKEDFKLNSQDESKSTYWPRLSTEINAYVDWGWTVEQIDRFISAFDSPYSGCKTFLNGELVFLKSSTVFESNISHHPFQSGIVIRKKDDEYFIATSNGILKICSITNEDNEKIIARLGDRFVTPIKVIEESKSKRIIYKTGKSNE